jgi:hypothetical protein
MKLAARIACTVAGLAACLAMHAQEISFKAAVDKQTFAAGDHVRLTITLTNSNERFSAPDLGGLVIVQGPFESSNFSFINGRATSSITRTWVLTATKPGRYTIGPARVKVGGGTIETEPIVLEVTKGETRPQDPYASQGQGRDANLFATVTLSRTKGYVGEQVLATYTLYNRYQNLELTNYDLPKMDGFWAENIEQAEIKWEDKLETVNGLQYRVAVLKRQILIPQRPGKLRIEPVRLTCVVNRSFFNRCSTAEFMSNAVEFMAMELPPGAPPGFSGVVGELQMSVAADRTRVRTDEAVELTVKVSGRANLKLLDVPKPSIPDDIEAFDPKLTDRISVNASGMSGTREFQWVLIPRFEGTHTIQPASIVHFDPKSGTYRTLTAAPITLEVSGAASRGGLSAGGAVRQTEVRQLARDIGFIRTGNLGLRLRGKLLFASAPWLAGMCAPPLAFALLFLWHRHRERQAADVAGTRRRQADRVARRRLRKSAEALHRNDRKAFFTALSQALQGYFADKFALGPAGATTDAVRHQLSGLAGGTAIADTYARLMAACDMARFAPVDERPRQELYDEAMALIAETEKLLRS